MTKMKKCSVCGKEIANNAKSCPECGAKQKKPIWKQWWIWAIVVVVVITIAGNGSENNGGQENFSQNNTVSVEEEKSIEYEQYSVSQMVDDLNSNAMAAEQKYGNKYLQITGRLSVIDSDGKYISIEPSDDEFSFTNVQCYIKDDAQKSIVASLKKGEILTIKVKIKSIGEVLGYTADIIEFVK